MGNCLSKKLKTLEDFYKTYKSKKPYKLSLADSRSMLKHEFKPKNITPTADRFTPAAEG